MRKITYLDFTNINYASYFLTGLIENEEAFNYRFVVTKQVPKLFEDLGLDTKWLVHHPPPVQSIFRYEGDGRDFYFCIDAGDPNGEDPEQIAYYAPLLERCDYYFKINYKRDAIAADERLAPYAHKIHPVPIGFPIQVPRRRQFLPKFTPFGGRRWSREGARRRIRELRQTPPLDYFRQLRHVERDLDLFFVSIYYPENMHPEEDQWRLAVIEELAQHKQLNAMMGFASHAEKLPGEYAPYRVRRMPFDEYMQQLARSKISLYVRGTHGCLSWKFGHLMSLAKPIVGQTLLNNRENMYQYDCFNEQFAYDDARVLAERVVALLEDPAEMARLEDINLRTFEQQLAPGIVTRGILERLLA